MAIRMCIKIVFMSSLKSFIKVGHIHIFHYCFVQGILRTYIEVKLKGTLQEANNVCLIDFAIAESDSQSVPSECHFE